jgi:hypothetical protein
MTLVGERFAHDPQKIATREFLRMARMTLNRKLRLAILSILCELRIYITFQTNRGVVPVNLLCRRISYVAVIHDTFPSMAWDASRRP